MSVVNVLVSAVLLMASTALLVLADGEASTCGVPSKFDDVGSKTALADLVFRGKFVGTTTTAAGADGVGLMRFVAEEVFKGELVSGSGQGPTEVFVGPFGSAANATSCALPASTTPNSVLIVFASSSRTSAASSWRLLGRPEPATKRNIKDAKTHGCAECVKRPTVALKPRQLSVVAEFNKTLRIECSSKDLPAANFAWLKDDGELAQRGHLRIKTTKRGSRIQISKVHEKDAGVYKCQATNVLGKSDIKSIRVVVAPRRVTSTTMKPLLTTPRLTTKEHSELCKTQDYCLNGGTCYILTQLRKQYCVCPDTHTNTRCQERRIDLPIMTGKSTQKGSFSRIQWDVFLIVLVSTIVFILGVALFITACCIIKSKCSTPSDSYNCSEPILKRDNAGRISHYRNINSFVCTDPPDSKSNHTTNCSADTDRQNNEVPRTLASLAPGVLRTDGDGNNNCQNGSKTQQSVNSERRYLKNDVDRPNAVNNVAAATIDQQKMHNRTLENSVVQELGVAGRPESQNGAAVSQSLVRNSCGYPDDSDPEATVV